jgi:hypothetical protein
VVGFDFGNRLLPASAVIGHIFAAPDRVNGGMDTMLDIPRPAPRLSQVQLCLIMALTALVLLLV